MFTHVKAKRNQNNKILFIMKMSEKEKLLRTSFPAGEKCENPAEDLHINPNFSKRIK